MPVSASPAALACGDVVRTSHTRWVIMHHQGTHLLLCPLQPAGAPRHRADVPLPWQDGLHLGCMGDYVVQCRPVRRLAGQGMQKIGTLSRSCFRHARAALATELLQRRKETPHKAPYALAASHIRLPRHPLHIVFS
ncbi:hypothetical protein HK16_20070 [Acetobacter senegalensis]|uniref:Uncharacterized protein n=2 Tax=Acetobacter TaxID=434 RepID=A0A252EFF4_9PROT|nr:MULTISPECIES: hypothetical protein [Acetobacter]ATJ90533.1 hypothetical protein CIW82_07375 [Acetobacter tropicalis]OUL64953.1 hypothetical protein HK16_20070 [Acetobacter senegalensis]